MHWARRRLPSAPDALDATVAGRTLAQHLAQLLLIAEEEAVVAVVHSPALTDELARYAWWCMPTIENARLMLMREVVCKGSMGRTLAEFLVEHLAFLHEDDVGILDTVAAMLVSGVLTDAERLSIWKRGSSRNSYHVAFLELQPDNLPNPRAARADHGSVPQLAGNPYGLMLEKALSGQGKPSSPPPRPSSNARKSRKWSTTL